MPTVDPTKLELLLLDDTVWLATAPVGLPHYDFDPTPFFPCRRPWQRPTLIEAVGRFGVADNYDTLYEQLVAGGVRLVNTPEEHRRASELTAWYPLLADLTPRSLWFDEPPDASVVEQQLGWPVFVKGSRQTSKHKASLAIARSADDYARIAAHYRHDSILRWQPMACRTFVPLRPVPASPSDTIPPSFEFRTFWWCGACVGAGPYWASFAPYTWTPAEERAALAVAAEAARRVAVPFLVVDVAQTAEGAWIVIECNDAQESGYAGVSPFSLWQRVVERERRHGAMA